VGNKKGATFIFTITLKFHKVVRQQNSGLVEDFILLYSAVYLWIQKWKNYWNRSTFAKVIVKINSGIFFMAHNVEKQKQTNNNMKF